MTRLFIVYFITYCVLTDFSTNGNDLISSQTTNNTNTTDHINNVTNVPTPVNDLHIAEPTSPVDDETKLRILYPDDFVSYDEANLFTEITDNKHKCKNYAYYQKRDLGHGGLACNITKMVNATYVFIRFGFNISDAEDIIQYSHIDGQASWKKCKFIFKQRNCPRTKIQCNHDGDCFNVDETDDFDIINTLRSVGTTAAGIFINVIVIGGSILSVTCVHKQIRKKIRKTADNDNDAYLMRENVDIDNRRYDYHAKKVYTG